MWTEIFLDQGSNGMILAGRLLDITQKDLRDDGALNVVYSTCKAATSNLSEQCSPTLSVSGHSVCTTLA